MEASSSQLLQELDQLLDGIDAGGGVGFDQDMDDPEYSSQQEEFRKVRQLQLRAYTCTSCIYLVYCIIS
jgi:hypothetical protein